MCDCQSFDMVFSDMDDTFLAHDKSIPDINLHALDVLACAGKRFIPCTGRAFAFVPQPVITHPSCAYVVAANGASIYNVGTEQLIRARQISPSVVRHAFDSVADLDVTFDIFSGNDIFTNARRFTHALSSYGLDEGTRDMLQSVRTPVDASTTHIIENLVDGIDKVTVYWGTEACRDAVAARFARIPGITVTSSHPRNFEFMASGVSKGEALRWLADYCAIDIANTLAFGDSLNDLSMLSSAGCGVAVANAAADVTSVIHELCASCDEGGPGLWLLDHLKHAL